MTSDSTPPTLEPTGWSGAVAAHRERQRRHICEVALELIGDQGFANVTMSELAKRSGIGRATLYHYFSSLEEVVGVWVEDEFSSFLRYLESEIRPIQDPREKLVKFVFGQCAYLGSVEHRRVAEHLMSGEFSPHVRDEVRRHLTVLRRMGTDTVREGVAQGQFCTDDPALTSDLILGLVASLRPHFLSHLYSPEDLAQAVVELVLEGLDSR